MAEVDCHGGRIGLRSVPASSSCAQLLPGENQITIRTALQDRVPLSLAGPGAGGDITAAGVLSDIVSAALHWVD
jgi:aspartokinase/homoserine dehydrogenase 1